MKNTTETIKKKLKHKELAIGSWITLGHPAIPEIMAKAGFDWLAVDMEHSSISIAQCQELIRVIDLCGLSALVRVGKNDSLHIGRSMDAGAKGVIVPMVNSRRDAEMAVSAVKYPPKGNRGAGLYRAQGYSTNFNEYRRWVEEESVVIVQIEHIQAVENMESILSTDGVDAFMVGPYDLSASLGVPGEFDNHNVKSALNEIQRIATKLKCTAAGYHVVPPDVELVSQKIKEGFTFIAYSVDFLLLSEMCKKGLSALR